VIFKHLIQQRSIDIPLLNEERMKVRWNLSTFEPLTFILSPMGRGICRGPISFLMLIMLFAFPLTAFSEDLGPVDEEGVKEVTELSMDEFTRLALQESLGARISRHNLGSNTFTRQTAYLQYKFPTASYNLTASRNDIEGSAQVNNSQTNTYDTSLTFTQPVYITGGRMNLTLDQNESRSSDLGQVSSAANKPQGTLSYTQPFFIFVQDPSKRAWRRTELGYENQIDAYEDSRLGVVFDARNLYQQVLLSLSQLGVEKKKLVSSQEVKRITQALVSAGRIAPIELNRAELRYLNDQRRLQNQRVSYWQILATAKDRVGISPDTVVVFTSTMVYTPFEPSLERLTEYAYVHLPSIRAARRSVELEQIAVQEAQEATRPKFNFNGTVGFDNQSNTVAGVIATSHDNQKIWSTALNMNWPFFDSHQTYYKVLAVKENLAIARLQLQQAERNTNVGIFNAYVDIKRTEEQIVGFEASRNQAIDNVRIVKARFRQGLDRLIDVFDAENASRDTDLEYLNLLFSFNQSIDTVSRSIGGDAKKVK